MPSKQSARQKLDYTVNQLNIRFTRPNLNRVMETVSKLLPFRNQRVGFSEFFWFLKHLKLREMMTAWAYFAPSDGFKFNFNGKKRCRPQSLLHSRMWKLPTSRCILIFILNNSVWRMGAKTLFSHSGWHTLFNRFFASIGRESLRNIDSSTCPNYYHRHHH